MSTYYIRIPDPDRARASGTFAFHSQSAPGMAEELQAALTGTDLFDRWRDSQDDPDLVDPDLGPADPAAQVTGDGDLAFDLVARTSLPGDVVRHRLRLLAGQAWELRDVRS
ncbi:hypothetical protein E4582_12790 [Luteimonas yindakuii]|uniref:Uncharacterized protein n=1 Tax=Luteimonas yindakuii TaxID=2565782 RepID=A0A4Z1RG48_9GAMM|nr:hypothetical protein [Luteimonas yindakuii]QCO66820.1 hypothetical protein E5843_01670 [Luteimonas yindakuii]TKS53069.1 hypothetical protein E4582_12790 [Luteimonas yindakuii]